MNLFHRHLSPKVSKKPSPIFRRCLCLEPSTDCVIVVSAGVNQEIFLMGMGKIRMHGGILSKCKKKNLHPGKLEPIHDLPDIRSDKTEIFGNDRKVWEFFFQGIQKIINRHLHPFSFDRRFFSCGDFPVRDQAPKMVNSEGIKKLKIMFYPFDPPSVATFFKNIPAINGVAP